MEFIEFLLHIDEHLKAAIHALGPLTYLILFAIIFAETGLVVIPFLPGDSLLFAAGALAGGGMLDLRVLIPVLLVAAIVGDSVNYAIGKRIGPRVFSKENARFFKPEHLAKTQEFYEKYGGKTIIIARFLPIVRTFAPFAAGVGNMRYQTFFFYNVAGAFIWVISLTLAGYFFGGIPLIKDNFEIAVILIVLASFIPPAVEYARRRIERQKAGAPAEATSFKELKDTFKEEHLSD